MIVEEHKMYVFDQFETSGDPLIALIAATPTASTTVYDGNRLIYMSHEMNSVLVLLHKLGLRGVPPDYA